MSIPLSACAIKKAADGDERTFQALAQALRYNLKRGGFSVFPCTQHQPPCEVSEKKMVVLNRKLQMELKAKP